MQRHSLSLDTVHDEEDGGVGIHIRADLEWIPDIRELSADDEREIVTAIEYREWERRLIVRLRSGREFRTLSGSEIESLHRARRATLEAMDGRFQRIVARSSGR